MWVKTSGPLSENVYQLTTAVSTHFLIGGEMAAIVDTGISSVHHRLQEELNRYLGNPSELEYIFITHAHFDHIGGIPYLRKFAPNAKVVAAPLTAQLLTDPENRKRFYEKNLSVARAMKAELELSEAEWCESLTVDRIMGDGDVIDLGAEVEVKLIASPGHTADSVAYFVRGDGALAAAEAVGSFNGRDQLASCFLSSFQDYLSSLDRLAGLEVKILGLPHAGALTGEMAGKFLVEARVVAERFAAAVKERLEQGELVEEIFNAQLLEWMSQNICPEGPFVEEQSETLRQMVSAVAESR